MENKPTESPVPRSADKHLLKKVLDDGQEALTSALRPFLGALGDRMFELSTAQNLSGSHRQAHFEALTSLKHGSDLFNQRFAQRLQKTLTDLQKTAAVTNPASNPLADEKEEEPKLGLVDLAEMERDLAVDKTVTALVLKHRLALECLTIRAAALLGKSPTLVKTPFHPAYIVEAFTAGLERLTSDSGVYTDSLAFFRERYLVRLERFYERLNSRLAAAGIEPGLEERIAGEGSRSFRLMGLRDTPSNPQDRRAGTSPKRSAREPAREEAPPIQGKSNPEEPPHSAEQSVNRAATPESNPARRAGNPGVYSAVMNALETSRSAGPAGAAAGEPQFTPAGGPPDHSALLQALETLGTAPAPESLEGMPSLESLVSGVSGIAPGAVDAHSAQCLGFVDNVFQTLNSTYDVSASMAPSLASLRIPLAHLSLREPEFFAQSDHPARSIIDRLSALASADQKLSPGVQKRVSEVVEDLRQSFTTDSRAFETANEALGTLAEQRENAVEKNIERLIEGLEGQQRLAGVQDLVEELLLAHFSQRDTPRPVIDLLATGWRTSLVQVALRDGEDSISWREEVALITDLQEGLDRLHRGSLEGEELQELRLRLEALGKRITNANPGSTAHESPLRELGEVLAGERTADTARYAAAAPVRKGTPAPARIAQLPKPRRWMKRVHDLKVGARLRYRTRTGEERRMRLVWVSDDRDRYAFANDQGQKIAELSAVQLARQLSRDVQPVGEVDAMQAVDRSIYRTLEEAQKSLSHARSHDAVTKLINGDAFVNQIRRCLRHAHRHDSEHALLLIDIDNFALVNEVFDETSGDQVLVEFAQFLARRNDERTLTARIGEDDFGVLVTHRDMHDARELADALRAEVGTQTFTIGEDSLSFTISVGIAPILQSTENEDLVLAQARDALEIAKAQGRNQVATYDLDQQERHRYQLEREQTQRRLDDAIAMNTLALRAQPIVQSAVAGNEGPTRHYELLLTLRDSDGELKSPQDFIGAAERFGYASQVDRWVIREAFAWISELVDRQKYVPQLSINLSGASITNDDFLDFVLEQISEYGVGTNRLCFEITETGSIENLHKAADFVRTLKNIGCSFSLDDFGTGLASHTYLKELPVDYVKIDGSFISDVSENRTDFAMAKSITDLAHFLGQKTIAECVENLELVPALREIGVDYLQGWGIGMPRPLSEVIDDLPDIET